VTYGLLILAASLPGLAVLLWGRRSNRQATRLVRTPARGESAPGGHPG